MSKKVAIRRTGATYYVSQSLGNDGNSGLTGGVGGALKTVAKVNASTFQPGDAVLFMRGDSWRERLYLWDSSWDGVTFGAYGVGAKPRFLGSQDLSLTTDWALGDPASGSVENTSDDCCISASSIYTTWMQLGNAAGTSLRVGIRFNNVAIAPGKTVSAASAQLRSNQVADVDTCNVRIRGEASVTPATFSTRADFAGRTETTAYVDWSAVPHWAADTYYSSPDLTAIIQEIIDMPSWSSGNDIVIFFDDNGSTSGAHRHITDYTDYAGWSASLSIITESADTTLWHAVTPMGYDIGSMVFGSEASVGVKVAAKEECTSQGDFCRDATSHYLFLYSAANPATQYGHIEAAQHWTAGIVASNGRSGIRFQDLAIVYQGFHGIYVGDGGANITIQRCDFKWIGGAYGVGGVTDRDGSGIQTKENQTNIIIRYCTFDECYEDGIDPQGQIAGAVCNGLYMYGNVFKNSTRGLEYWYYEASESSNHIYFVNNTIYGMGGGAHYSQRTTSDQACGVLIWAYSPYTNCVMKNNVFHTTANKHVRFMSAGALANWDVDNNCYYPDGAAVIQVVGAASYNFAGWQAIGQDAHGMTADPLLTDPTNGDFTLQAGSPCIDAGVAVSGIPWATLGSAPDMGYSEKA